MMNIRRVMVTTCLAAAGLGSAGALKAFPGTDNWMEDASQDYHCGNSYNMQPNFGTGGVKDWGITCAMCHINNANQQGNMQVKITPSPAWAGSAATPKYLPGQQYQITFQIITPNGELGANGGTKNRNGFAMTFEDVNGGKMGTLTSDVVAGCPAQPPTVNTPNGPIFADIGAPAGTTSYTYGTCRAITSLNNAVPLTTWKFNWKAPAAGSGTVYGFYGAIDGDSLQTCLGDDVKVGSLKLTEGP
jgi:hypothetical protein